MESFGTAHASAPAEAAGECVGCRSPVTDERCGGCGCARFVKGFRVVKLLHKSSQTRLYLAEDADSRKVTLKEIAFPFAADAEQLAAFVRESDALAQLDHPQLPRHVESFWLGAGAGQRLYLAQGFVAGDTLEQRLNNHRFSTSEVRVLIQQLLEPIVHLQSLKPMVIHRDLKPSSIVLRPDGTLALVDFGSTRAVLGAAGHPLPLGTPGYMPPEQLAGKHNSTTDVYAVAAIALQLLSRLEPHEILEQGPVNIRRWASVDAGFAAFLTRALSPEVKDRFPDAATALAELKKAVATRKGKIGALALVAAAIVTVPALVIGLDLYRTATAIHPTPYVAPVTQVEASSEEEETLPVSTHEHTTALPVVAQVPKGDTLVKVAGVEAVPEVLEWLRDDGSRELADSLESKLSEADDLQMVVGRLVVPDGVDPMTVQAPMEILDDGWFAVRLQTLKTPIHFAGYELEPLAVQVTRAAKGTAPLYIGELHQTALAPAHYGDVNGQVSGNLYAATVKLSLVSVVGEPPSHDMNDPELDLDKNGRFRLARGTPGKYQLTVDAPDQLTVIVPVTIVAGKTTTVAPIELVPALSAELEWMSDPDRTFYGGYAKHGSFASGEDFLAVEELDDRDFNFEQRGGKLFGRSTALTGEPWGYADLGSGSLDDFNKPAVLSKKLAHADDFELKPGHVYLVNSPLKRWILLRVAALTK